jgi:hypothetical protein
MNTLILYLALMFNTEWCPPLDHPHTKQFRYGQWMKKNGQWQRSRLCQKKSCKNYKIKQYQYANSSRIN